MFQKNTLSNLNWWSKQMKSIEQAISLKEWEWSLSPTARPSHSWQKVKAWSKCLFKSDRLGASTTFWGILFQCLTSLVEKKCFLMSSLRKTCITKILICFCHFPFECKFWTCFAAQTTRKEGFYLTPEWS